MRSLATALEMLGQTDVGRLRSHNEDTIRIDTELGFLVLADGMGGYNAGEVASSIAVEVMHEVMQAQLAMMALHSKNAQNLSTLAYEMLAIAINRSNAMIFQTGEKHPQCAGMGTTLVSALFFDNRVAIAHVGDSRAYRFRQQQLLQLSHDHSFLQEQVDAGLISAADARHAPYKNLVTRAVGVAPEVQPEIHEFAVEIDDLYLFCSDGLSDMLTDEVIALQMAAPECNLNLMASTLVELANAHGGKDNISVILVKINRDFSVQTGLLKKVGHWFS
ncbi:Stp1/IreP family PP2C-type Ser/Thr phosphatase [Deefgea salmonis]|uniref:Stp1/IreP family PP2C-type Ser/Thr phosphatase n=1 Tax=Deefgea salmonis TaxID=2875502 RepID=A0ABS8BKJ3_9NEIS|nr:Stp1/IreP family PP2C-type Ser/Thr phosphatase [Deefgea salmonis]MCB5196056.1 Stp1/IreP family PP2C-type Ser/Thr phosphatase [Deefgea salmonis]